MSSGEEDSSGDEYHEEPRGSAEYQVGAIVRLYLKNFMQYSECEMLPGPTLNVIIGPNGSGKSSVVNGLALALGSKTNVLGRAEDLKSFIRTGADFAQLEVELKGTGGHNLKITRKWYANKDDKSQIWTLDGKRSTQKAVVEAVRALNIQTDNLCQFLPQDKVHDFSRMNNKEMLSKTIDAVGRQELKDDHQELKTMQQELNENDDRFRSKANTLTQLKNKVQNLEGDVQNFAEKEKIQKKMKLCKKRMRWAQVNESFRNLHKAKQKSDEIKNKLRIAEEELQPFAERIQAKESERSRLKTQIDRTESSSKTALDGAKAKMASFEREQDGAEGLDDHVRQAEEKNGNRDEHIRKMEADVERMKRELENSENNEEQENAEQLQQQVVKTKKEAHELTNRLNAINQTMQEMNYEKRSAENKVLRARDQLTQLTSVEQQKKEILATRMPQGGDTIKALRWLDNNRDNFKDVNPLMMCIDVEDPQNAIFFENVIAQRDLVAFGASSPDEMNTLLRQFREGMGLRVNAVTLPQGDPERDFPTPNQSFPPEFNFVGYLSQMFTAPDPVKYYLCKQYRLHTIPVFKEPKANQAAAILQRISDSFNLKVFFFGRQRYSCVTSRYSGKKSTSSANVFEKSWLNISVDKALEQRLQSELEKQQNNFDQIAASIREHQTEYKTLESHCEAKKTEAKNLANRLNYKTQLQTRVRMKENEIGKFKQQNPPVNIDAIKKKVEEKKAQVAQKLVRINIEVERLLSEGIEHKTKAMEQRLMLIPVTAECDALRREQGEKERVLEPLRIQDGEYQENVRIKKDVYKEILAKAQEITGDGLGYTGDKPPKDLLREFESEGLTDQSSEECKLRWEQFDLELQRFDDVDPAKIEDYKEAKKQVASLEHELSRWEAEQEQKLQRMEAIRDRWQRQLEELIGQISAGFSQFFATMGFAGEVKLGHGDNLNDFDKYGIDIYVKFRENVAMSKLDPFTQSGGERSVSTALYMLALQHLTKVPFRCVDEINQGMDAKNERRVFDMLIETAVRRNSAQYFLLTPKLLPNLNYDRGVTVLIVYNGDDMAEFTRWNNDEFLTQEETYSENFSQLVTA